LVEKEQREPVVALRVGRRTYALASVWKGLGMVAAAAISIGAFTGTIMHIFGWDFVSIPARQFEAVDRRIIVLDSGQRTLVANQRVQRADIDTLKQEARRQSRYQCFIIRRTNPELLEPGDPCQPIPTRR
jgi:hypothetical protein